MKNGNDMIEVHRNFKYNISKAKNLVDLIIIKNFREKVFIHEFETFVDDFRKRLQKILPILTQDEISGPLGFFSNEIPHPKGHGISWVI